MGDARKAGVVGYPVNHSLSPRLHNYWIRQYNINASYEAFPVEPDKLEDFLRKLPESGFAGVNLTIPHKEAAIKFLDEVNDFARWIGAVNTVIVRDGVLIGKNTDAYGFIQNLISGNRQLTGKDVLVMGAGGAARAVCISLLGAQYKVTIANRTKERAEALAASLDNSDIKVIRWDELENSLSETSLLVNTTSLGMKGQQPLELSLDNLPQESVVTDIVYNPLVTPLLAMAAKRGNPVVDGLGMLLYQAQMSFYEWFGIKPEVTNDLREHVLQGLR